MGFNATVVVLLDQLDRIERDPNFGKQLADAIRHKSARPNEDHQYVVGQTQVIEVHHADNQVVVAVGGNTGQVLGYGGSYRSSPDDMIKWLNSDRLARKRAAKRPSPPNSEDAG
jgi:hypothetical protein